MSIQAKKTWQADWVHSRLPTYST